MKWPRKLIDRRSILETGTLVVRVIDRCSKLDRGTALAARISVVGVSSSRLSHCYPLSLVSVEGCHSTPIEFVGRFSDFLHGQGFPILASIYR